MFNVLLQCITTSVQCLLCCVVLCCQVQPIFVLVQFTLFVCIAQCTLFSAHCSMCTLFRVHIVPCAHCSVCTLFRVQYNAMFALSAPTYLPSAHCQVRYDCVHLLSAHWAHCVHCASALLWVWAVSPYSPLSVSCLPDLSSKQS